MDEYGMNIPQIATYTCVLECGGHMEDSNMMHVIWTGNRDIFCRKVERMSRCVHSQKEMSDVRSSYLYIKYPIAPPGATHLESAWLWLA